MAAFWKFGRHIRDCWKVLIGGENDDLQRQIQNMEKQLARLRQRKLVQDKEREEFALDEARHSVKKIRDLHDSLMAADAATAKFAEKLGEKARAILEVQIQTSEKYQAAAVAKQKQFLQEHAKKCMEGNAELSSLELLAQLGKQGASTIQVEKLETLDQEKPRNGAVEAIQILPEESRHGDEQAGDLIMQAKTLENIIQEEPTTGGVQVTESLPGVSTQGDGQDAHLSMLEEKAESIDQEVSKRSVMHTTPLTDVEPIDEDTVFDPCLVQDTPPSSRALVSPKMQVKSDSPSPAPAIRVEEVETLNEEKPRSGAVEAIQVLPEASTHGAELTGDLIMQAKTLESINLQEHPPTVVEVAQVVPGVSMQGDEQDTNLLMQAEKTDSIDQEMSTCFVMDTTPRTNIEPIGEDTGFDPHLKQDTQPSSK